MKAMDIDKLLTKTIINTAVEVLLDEQSRCGGTIPHNFYTHILNGLHKKEVLITRSALCQRVCRANAKLLPKSPTVNPSPPTAEVTFARHNGTPSSASAASSDSASASATQSNADEGSPTLATPNDNSSSSSNDNTARKKGGRPKGTGIVQQKEKKDNYAKCKNAITTAYIAELAINKTLNKSNNDILRKLIEAKKAEFKVTDDIPLSTIKSRVAHNKK